MPHRQDIGDGVALYDYKTTEASANPHAFVRTFYGCGYDFRAAWYARGIKAVLGIEEPAVRFVVQEVSPPYKIAVFQLTPYAMSYAMDRVERAIKLWTNPGDVVFTPFLGIGSEAYIAVKLGRIGIGAELKRSYWEQAVRNLRKAESEKNQFTLFNLFDQEPELKPVEAEYDFDSEGGDDDDS